ncbi:MAG TPA: methyltransferase [Mariprofundaceae bacterium]|nr:methyltransferase [Mariprofundaceae bacterium]
MKSFAKNNMAVKAFQRALKFASWMQNLPNKMAPPPMRLMQIGSLYWQSRALYVAVRLDVATVLSNLTLTTTELAEKCGCNSDSLYRLLRMLISMGIFVEPESGKIANNSMSAYLDREHPQCVRSMILMHNSPQLTRSWTEALEDGVCNGEIPFKCLFGKDLFGYMEADQDFAALFASAMDTTDALIGGGFLGDFDWSRYERLIDVGGSKGSKAIAILKQFPHLKAVVFDYPKVVEKARGYWQGKVDDSLLERIEFVAGDARESVPEAGEKDVYLLCAVFHGLSDADSVAILKNLHTFPADVAIFDAVMADRDESLMITSFDMQMLISTEGRERTASEWQTLFDAAGFGKAELYNTRSLWKLQLLELAD